MTASTGVRLAPSRWRAVVPAIAAVTVATLPGFLTAGVAVQVGDDIGLSLAGLGAVIGLFFAVSAVASPAMGRVVERYGWAAGTRITSVVAAVALAGVGLTARSPLTLGAWLVLAGIGGALSHPAANLAVARCIPADRHGLAYGAKHASVPAATLLGGLAVPAVALTVGWEWAYVGAAALAVLVGATVPRRPSAHEIGEVAAGAPTEATSMPRGLLVALGAAALLGIAGMDALASFIVTYGVETGFGEATAGLLLAAGSVAGVTTRLVAGWAVDRTRRTGLTAIAVLLIVGAAGIAGIAAGDRAGLVIGGLVGFGAGWGWSGLFTFAVVRGNTAAPAAATGLAMTGVWLGAALGPPLFGVVADQVSYAAAWWATAASLLGAAAIMLAIGRRLEAAAR